MALEEASWHGASAALFVRFQLPAEDPEVFEVSSKCLSVLVQLYGGENPDSLSPENAENFADSLISKEDPKEQKLLLRILRRMVSPRGNRGGWASVAAGGQGTGVVFDLVSVKELPVTLPHGSPSPRSPTVTVPQIPPVVSFPNNWRVKTLCPLPLNIQVSVPLRTKAMFLLNAYNPSEESERDTIVFLTRRPHPSPVICADLVLYGFLFCRGPSPRPVF